MLSSKTNSSSCNYQAFPENDINVSSPYTTSSFFPNSPNHMHLEYQDDVYLQFLELFYQHHSSSIITHNHETTPADSNENVMVLVKEDAEKEKATMRPSSCSKKDRHSKINTARGPRDRRMRLSLDIARRFFDLQDQLGYDKASTTVEWLLRHSGPAITELSRGRLINAAAPNDINNNPRSEQSSTCEQMDDVVSSAVPSKNKRKRRREKVKIRVVGRATVARESRRKARERARERTSQKRRLIISQGRTHEEAKPYGESVGEGLGSHCSSYKQSHVPIYVMQQQVAAGNQVEDLSSDEARIIHHHHYHQLPQVCTPAWNPSTLFSYQEDNSVLLNQDEQITEFQFGGES